MLLWKATFSSGSDPLNSSYLDEPWKEWWRLPGPWVRTFCRCVGYSSHSFRCGNGLLTHILTTQGYEGYGIDLRARISWSNYPESTQAQLHIHALDPACGVKIPAVQDKRGD